MVTNLLKAVRPGSRIRTTKPFKQTSSNYQQPDLSTDTTTQKQRERKKRLLLFNVPVFILVLCLILVALMALTDHFFVLH